MSERIHALAQLMLGKTSVEECSLEELQQLTKRYPYFAPAQFLLLQKLKSASAAEYEAQQRKAVLYYHDPLEFDYFISSDKFYVDESLLKEKTVSDSPLTESAETVQPIPEENIVEEETFLQQQEVERSESEEIQVADAEETQPIEDISATSEPIAHSSPETEITEEEKPAEDATSVANETALPDEEAQATGIVEKAGEDKPQEEKAIPVNNHPAAGEPLAFEPFHTVDYFASQGIKITAEDVSKDKLSKQVRSFTEWLKIMKRLPAVDIAQTPQSSAEKNVEHMASHSVEESDVVTEAMAEVWAKQGNARKAIETYNKLSLLNPSKKAYFADKIENLKGS